ncbi:hypothetical protein Tco_1250275 [Tanacetum coccineum]
MMFDQLVFEVGMLHMKAYFAPVKTSRSQFLFLKWLDCWWTYGSMKDCMIKLHQCQKHVNSSLVESLYVYSISKNDNVNASEPYTLPANVNDGEPHTLPANFNDSEHDTLPASVNASEHEIVASIVQELLSMNYDFDPFEDNVTASVNEQTSFNE